MFSTVRVFTLFLNKLYHLVSEILGIPFTFKPEISISDIAEIAALISSALIFYFGYSQTKKSEQIKIAREVMGSIRTKHESFMTIPKSELANKKHLDACCAIIDEIFYFQYLLGTNEIRDKHILSYYVPKLQSFLDRLDSFLRSVSDEHHGISDEANKTWWLSRCSSPTYLGTSEDI